MLRYVILVVIYCLIEVKSIPKYPRIIIVGAGASGIAAASRLMQNGFNNITILEAENRIGGRIFTTRFGGYWVDLGGQWVHGEVDNVAYELAWPLALIEHSNPSLRVKFFSSSGSSITEETAHELFEYYINLINSDIPEEYANNPIGTYYELKFNEFFDTNYPNMTSELRKSLVNNLNSLDMADMAGDTWHNIVVNQEEELCEGDQRLNWMNLGYRVILDILMKRLPMSDEELPILNRTILNAEVTKINYDSWGNVRVITSDGNAYSADHVIVTTSVGVLKADYERIFFPPLPARKINAIKGIELGSVAKIYLVYSDPWWPMTNGTFLMNLHWTENDKKEYANDWKKSWMLGIATVATVEHKPRLLCCWVTGPHAREMENISENLVFEQITGLLYRFFGNSYNLTQPASMLRSRWFTNRHFRGTWSYRSPKSKRLGATAQDLAEPLKKNENPVVLFAGEATNSKHPSTVHGAIESGWREANRIMDLYPDRKSIPKISHWGEQFWQIFNEDNTILRQRLSAGEWQTVAAKKQKST